MILISGRTYRCSTRVQAPPVSCCSPVRWFTVFMCCSVVVAREVIVVKLVNCIDCLPAHQGQKHFNLPKSCGYPSVAFIEQIKSQNSTRTIMYALSVLYQVLQVYSRQHYNNYNHNRLIRLLWVNPAVKCTIAGTQIGLLYTLRLGHAESITIVLIPRPYQRQDTCMKGVGYARQKGGAFSVDSSKLRPVHLRQASKVM